MTKINALSVSVSLLLCLTALFLALSTPTHAQRCTQLPSRLTSSITQIWLDSNLCTQMRLTGDLFFDYYAKLARLDVNVVMGDPKNSVDLSIFVNYNTQTEYILVHQSGQCNEQTPTLPIGFNTIPSNAIFTGNVQLGIQTLDTYFVPDNFLGQSGLTGTLSVTSGTCFLTSMNSWVNNATALESQPPVPSTIVQSFWNIVPTVPSMIFEVPAVCTSGAASRGKSVHRIPIPFF